MRPVLVTGAGGFIGARIAAGLEDRGRNVRRWSHRRPDLRDPAARARMLAGVGAVVHAAAELDPDVSEADLDDVNHRAAVALAEEAARAGAARFVLLSSQAAVGWWARAGALDEATPCRPTTAYGRAKLAAERGLGAAAMGACRWAALRPPTVYGAEERRNFLLLARAASLGLHPLPGGGHNRMSFCHVENLVEAVLHVLDGDLHGVVHVADPEAVTLRRALGTIARAAGSVALPVPVPRRLTYAAAAAVDALANRLGIPAPISPARVDTVSADCFLDTGRLAASGWRPPVGFDEGVGETVRAYREAGLLPGSARR